MILQILKPTDSDPVKYGVRVFLAGSIEMGVAEDWQTKIQEDLEDLPVTVFNPRRESWDSSWEQKISNPQFNFQVNWEMDRSEQSDIIFMYFSPDTKSPISLLELGIHAGSGKLIVCCPDGFWRKGNVEIVCARYGIPLHNNLDEATGALVSKICSIKI